MRRESSQYVIAGHLDFQLDLTRVQSGNYVRTELPVRIAHRLRDLQALPYVVVTQEGMDKVYQVRSRLLRPFVSNH